MKIKEYLDIRQNDVDTFDKTFEVIVTCCHITDEEFEEEINDAENSFRNYFRFIKYIYENVDVVNTKNIICDWAGFVKEHYNALYKFMEEHWMHCYENKDDFIYQWIKEIHYYLAGYTTEENYNYILELLEGK